MDNYRNKTLLGCTYLKFHFSVIMRVLWLRKWKVKCLGDKKHLNATHIHQKKAAVLYIQLDTYNLQDSQYIAIMQQ
jgi:hypothetical protein